MSYVPIVTPTSVPPPSPRTRELAGLLHKLLDEYTKAHFATSKGEIRAAIRMAQMSAGPDRTKIALGLSLGLGLMVAMLGVGLVFFQGGSEVEFGPIFPMIILVAIVLFGLVAVIVKMQSR